MDISVVIPTYKRPALLFECLACLESQSLMRELFEVIVVSDGYDELTASALDAYQKKSNLNITFLHTPGKQGPAAARNLGWKKAKAPIIAFTDDDCKPQRGWLTAFLSRYRKDEPVVFSGFTKVPVPQNPTDFALNTYHLQTADFITANCACTKSALLKVDGFDEGFKTAWREDSDLEFRFVKAGIPLIKTRDAVVIHPVRQHVPWGVSIKEQKKGLYDALLYKKHPDLYRSRIQPYPLWNYYVIILCTLVFLISVAGGYHRSANISGIIALVLILLFFLKRIRSTSKRISHLFEMLVTSMIIPFVSVYWRFYGAFKYHVFFL